MTNLDPLRELILPRLDAVKKSGGGFMARCPAHDDGQASLSLSPGTTHPVLLHCHAGCSPEDILARLDLTWADLSNPRERQGGDAEWTPAGPAAAVYNYRDEDGELLFQVLRTVNKSFLQRVPDAAGKHGWRWKLGDTRRVLYRLPELIQAVQEGQVIYIAEGEKDVENLRAQGFAATCNSGGAGKWRPEYAEFLREAVVTICADKDEPGQAHARQVRDALVAVGATVEIVEARIGKDVSDHLAAGLGLDELEVTWTNDQPTQLDLAPDLWEFLDTADEDYDWIVPDLLERGDRLMLTGFEGLGKSMLTRQLAVMIAAGTHPFQWARTFEPRRVLYIDCENSERQSRRKFRPLARASESSRHRVPDGGMRLIHKPNGLDLTRKDDEDWLLERVTAHQPDVLFIGPFYRLHNANLNDELPARRTVSVLDKARNSVGCALVIEAHAGHGNQVQQRDVRPTGSSLLLRWPEFGYGIAPLDKDPKHVRVMPWRGPRDERQWPKQLTWGDPDGWPWMEYLTAEETR
jgi:hypothetical protein